MVVSARLLLAVRVQPPRAPRFSFPPRRSLQRTLVPLPYIPRARLYSSLPVECNSPISQAYSLSREPFAGRSSSSTTTPHSPNFRVISCSFFPLFISIVVEPLRLFLLLLGMLVYFCRPISASWSALARCMLKANNRKMTTMPAMWMDRTKCSLLNHH